MYIFINELQFNHYIKNYTSNDKYKLNGITNDAELLSDSDNTNETINFCFSAKNGLIYYHKCSNTLEMLILTEINNHSDLWRYSINDTYIKYSINPTCNAKTLKQSQAVCYYISLHNINNDIVEDVYKVYNLNKKTHIEQSNYIQSNNINVNLFNYQQESVSNMIQFERNHSNINSIIKINLLVSGREFIVNYDIFNNKITDSTINNITINTDGGILADEMGLGKTITTLSLIDANPSNELIANNNNNIQLKDGLIYSKATLIICPAHIISQWQHEIKKTIKDIKVITIITKPTHNKITYKDLINADIILVSFQFITNNKYYSKRYSYDEMARLYLTVTSDRIEYNINELLNTISDITVYDKDIRFELINFHRIIIDEGHEVLSNNEYDKLTNIPVYFQTWLEHLVSKYKWIVSGTPIINHYGLINILKFINIKINNNNINNIHKGIIYNSFNDIFDCFYIRHTKEQVEAQVNVPKPQNNIIWVNMTPIEEKIYLKNNKATNKIKQQLCCHILVSETDASKYNNFSVTTSKVLDLDEIQNNLIKRYISICDLNTTKINKLNPEAKEYHMLKAKYQQAISEARYMISILSKICSEKNEVDDQKTDDDSENINNCSICLDEIINKSITGCGHVFCSECIHNCLEYNKQCPMCKKNISINSIYEIVNNKSINNDNTLDNYYMKTYGSKLGKIIALTKQITADQNNRIIIFSQWDNMLHLVSKTLNYVNVKNTFLTGNVWVKTASLNKFKNINDVNVIMLSLNNSASGANLIEATHIIFIEPIDLPYRQVKSIEEQAIGRACRIGQKKTINIIRILTKNTIEEQIFNSVYKVNIT